MRYHLPLIVIAVLLVTVWSSTVAAQEQQPAEESCRVVRYLMEREITPYDLTLGGGVLRSEEPHTGTLAANYYADTWSFNAVRPRNLQNLPLPDSFSITFDAVTPGLELEFALFFGMEMIADETETRGYRPVIAGETYTYPIFADGIRTLVVRRSDVTHQTPGSYTFTPVFNGGEPAVENLRDNSTNRMLATPPSLENGHTGIPLEAANIHIHAGAPTSVAAFEGRASQVRFGPTEMSYGVLVNAWADEIYLLGGDLAVRGTGRDTPRLFYLKDYGHRIDLQSADFNSVVDSNGTRFRIGWEAIMGAWIVDRCAGFKLDDGRTFTGIIEPTPRDVTFRGSLNDFTLQLNTADAAGNPASHRVDMDWFGVAPGFESQIRGGIFSTQFSPDKSIRLQSTDIQMHHRLTAERLSERTPLNIDLEDRGASILLDWANMSDFQLVGDEVTVNFLDEPRTAMTRSAVDLLRFDALEDVIEIVYQDTPDGLPGKQHLLLPREESYIELVTPAGLPEFDGRALPGEPGFAPRALNNVGGECYPINTLQEEVNCPPNGHPNPANGNVWYAVTDLLAQGQLIDLALTRSYNSGVSSTGGPFGFGWTTAFLLRYQVPFNAATNSRVVDPDAVAAYPVSLDLTWAPRGIVTFITPSGSRHVFATESNRYTGGELTALTMPGWILSRDRVRDPSWTLRQDSGLTFEFDRAGRLASYGFPQEDRLITVDYPRETLSGPDESTPTVITDAANLRRLELYYDSDHHIARSILRDVTVAGGENGECDPSANCYETSYTYTDGYLTRVTYADGNEATYAYDDETGKLVSHDDPRAPISPTMTYQYGDNGSLEARITPADGEPFRWRRIRRPATGSVAIGDTTTTTRNVAVTDEFGATRTYSYAWLPGSLKQAGTSFTLLARSGPLSDVTEFESLPVRYEWENGLLARVLPRLLGENTGRNSTQFEYTGPDNITRIRTGYPGFSAVYEQFGERYLPQALTFADETTLTYTYDDRGWISTVTDELGAVYTFTWDDLHRLIRIVSESDQTQADYTYNQLGLVTSVTKRRVEDDDPSTWYIVTFDYDAFGRLLAINDPLTGDYTFSYGFERGEDGLFYTSIDVVDAIGTITTLLLDGRGRLAEERISVPNSDSFPRRTTYKYGIADRLNQETRWLAPMPDAEEAAPTPLTTHYEYIPVAELPSFPGDTEGSRIINGYMIDVTDPHGRMWNYYYDGLNRIRMVEDELRRVTRYDYEPTSSDTNLNGLRVRQRNILNNRLISTTDYIFDLRWQLRSVLRNGDTWEIFFQGDSTRLQALRARQAGLFEQNWGDYVQGRPAGIRVTQVDLQLNSGTLLPNPSLDVVYDFRGRPLQVTDGTGTIYNVLYCPLENGAEKVIYTLPASATGDGAAPTCETAIAARALYYDAAGRLIQVDDPTGTRTYSYQAEPGGWAVDVALDGFAWKLYYNGAGDLVRWEGEHGHIEEYQYDTLGRLRRVSVRGEPEASFTYNYNGADLLVSALDDLGRGTFYDYDELGRLTVKQNARTADATIYGYNSEGLLSTIISPLGNTTTFLYEDTEDATRLTGIIEPTGSTVRFDWQDQNNQLTHIDARGNQTTYQFDSFGALWNITDATDRNHELHYDAAGHLTAWWQSQRRDELAARRFDLQRTVFPSAITISEMNDSIDWQRTFTLTPADQISLLSGSAGAGISFGYDALGRLTQIGTEDRSWTLTHEADRPTMTLTDGFGQQHNIRFDALNRLVSREVAGNEITYTYEQVRGSDLDVTVENTTTRIYTFATGDESSRPTTITLATPGQRRTYTYNAEGLLDEISAETCIAPSALADLNPQEPDACIRTTADEVWRVTERFVYDSLGRPVRYIDPEQNIETYSYDDAGNLVSYQDTNGKTFTYTYDELNRLDTIAGPTGLMLLLRYDDLDRVIGICRGHTEDRGGYTACAEDGRELETYAYDSLGRITAQTFPITNSQSTLTYAYDPENGGLLSGWSLDGDPAVSITRAADGLGLLQQIATTGEDYDINYESDSRLAASGDFSYTYDSEGRVESITVGGQRLIYEYAPNNQGYRITDEATGAQISFRLDARGLLSDIEPGLGFEYFLSPDSRILVVQITRDDGELIELQFNQRGDLLNIAYRQDNIFVDFVSDAAGQVQRESLIGGSDFFEGNATGYINVIGYDNDDRPLTMRISDRGTGQLLYLQTFTYDSLGLRGTETRQYADGTQITLNYIYEGGSQLVERTLSITSSRSVSMNGSPLLLLIGVFAWMLRSPTRRRLVLTLIATAALTVITLSLTGAQQAGVDVVQQYEYDNAGNLIEVRGRSNGETVTCTTYTYDSANRLLQVRDGEGEALQRYSYDVRNRLATIGDQRLLYHGDTNILLGVTDSDGQIRYIGQAQNLPPFFQSQDSQTEWFINDGRHEIMALTEGNETTQPLWLFSPLGRFLSLESPANADTVPCPDTDLPPQLVAASPLQILQTGMIWDAITGLYFTSGRAYSPELRRFLQRDPLGPDVFGNVYSFPSRQTVPPVAEGPPAYLAGLYKLRDALQTIRATETLTAAHIARQHRPAPALQSVEPLIGTLDDVADTTQRRLARQLDLPAWLATNYNLSGAYIDDGALRLPPDNAPGQGGIRQPFTHTEYAFDPAEDWLPQIGSPLTRLQRLTDLSTPDDHSFTTYLPFAAQPPYPELAGAWNVNRPLVGPAYTPSAVWHWLPQPLRTPERNATVFDALQALDEMPDRTGQTWVDAALDGALPDLPDLPPDSSRDWLANWFSWDTLGVADTLRARWPELPQADVPVYRVGVNPNWRPIEHR